jgi:ABC-2 type transport system ATP-binding protein
LRSLAADGRTVLLSSHLMSEMSITADRLIIIGRGRLIADTTVRDLLERGSGRSVRVTTPQAAVLAALLEVRGAAVELVSNDTLVVTGITSETVGRIATANALALRELSTQRPSLEETYMELTRDALDYRTHDAPVVSRT